MTRNAKFENEVIAFQSYGIVKLALPFLYLVYSPL